MKFIQKSLSYILVAALASALTLFLNTPKVDKLDQLLNLADQLYVEDVDLDKLRDAAAQGIISALGDRWSFYISADEMADYQEQMNNAYVGVGIELLVQNDASDFKIMAVTAGGPAEKAGLKVGDILMKVNGQLCAELGVNGTTALIRGEAGTTVELTMLRDGQELTFTVKRQYFEVPVASSQMLQGNVGLVTIKNFDGRCALETKAAIEVLLTQGAKAIIFDVRNNGGGYKDEMVQVLDYLLPEGKLFVSKDHTGKEQVDMSDEACLDIPMAVLVNENSYSAAELFAAALQEYDAATVVGQKTSGKGYYQITYELVDGSAVALSVGTYCTPNGVSLEGVGFTPDIPVEVDEEIAEKIYFNQLSPREDPQLQAALQALLPSVA